MAKSHAGRLPGVKDIAARLIQIRPQRLNLSVAIRQTWRLSQVANDLADIKWGWIFQ